MSKTLLTGMGAALGAALLLAACGSDKSTTSTTTTTTTTPSYGSTTVTPAPTGSTTIERSTTTKSEGATAWLTLGLNVLLGSTFGLTPDRPYSRPSPRRPADLCLAATVGGLSFWEQKA